MFANQGLTLRPGAPFHLASRVHQGFFWATRCPPTHIRVGTLHSSPGSVPSFHSSFILLFSPLIIPTGQGGAGIAGLRRLLALARCCSTRRPHLVLFVPPPLPRQLLRWSLSTAIAPPHLPSATPVTPRLPATALPLPFAPPGHSCQSATTPHGSHQRLPLSSPPRLVADCCPLPQYPIRRPPPRRGASVCGP